MQQMQTQTSCRSNAIIEAPTNEVLTLLLRFYVEEVSKRGMTVQGDGQSVKRAADFLTDTGRKSWLFLSGNVGTGKTTLLTAIRRTIDHYYIPCRMFRASDFPVLFLNNVEQTERQIMRGDWCRVLLLDDIGVEQTEIKEYGNTIQPFVKIVEERYNRSLPLIVSTNLSGAEMAERYGKRTIDRISEMSVGIKYEQQSYRK